MNKFIDQVISNLKSNGFPGKRVSLPMEKMFEVADNKGFSFNAVLDEMKANHKIEGIIEGERIIFTPMALEESNADMMKKAQEMMANMDPAELEKMKDLFMNMSSEEKEDMMKKGRDMGIV